MEQMEELRALVARHAREGRNVSAIPHVALMRSSATTTPIPTVYELTLCIVAQGAKRVMVSDRVYEYDAAKYLVASVATPANGEVSQASADRPYLAFSLGLDPPTLADVLLEMPRDVQGARLSSGLAVSPVTPDLLDPVLRLARLLDRPSDVAVLAPLAEREILYRLLVGEQGWMLRQIAMADSRLAQVQRAITWIRANYARPFRIDVVAQVTGMSPSSLHRHFKAVTHMSPLQYQKRIRLQEARQRLLAKPADAADVGFAVGYESPSQFSREYSRLFGVPPGRDAARLRRLSRSDSQLMVEPL